MVVYPTKVISALAVFLAGVSVVAEKRTVTSCSPGVTAIEDRGYHSDHTCNRAIHNSFKESLNRHARYEYLTGLGKAADSSPTRGGIHAVPSQTTVTCPVSPRSLHTTENGVPPVDGFDTVWFVENTSSSPVVVSWVARETNIEYSAFNSKISPAYLDPMAIIPPGEWRTVNSFEGHVFHVRLHNPLAPSMLGPIVLQHRMGLVDVGSHAIDLTCPDVDAPPVIKASDQDAPALDPDFARTPTIPNRPCGTIDIGFRNKASCPLHGYYLKDERVEGKGYGQCTELFRLHLGFPNTDAVDFRNDWVSPTKFEGSYIGHSFVFRNAHDNKWVQTVTLQPTYITDCPGLPIYNSVASNVTALADTLATVLPLAFSDVSAAKHDLYSYPEQQAWKSNITTAFTLPPVVRHRRSIKQSEAGRRQSTVFATGGVSL
jgi:hypothetical protein